MEPNTAACDFVANWPLAGNVAFTNDSSFQMSATKGYDLLNRLPNIVSTADLGNLVTTTANTNTSGQSQTWGLDLNGSLQGASGVGGLLFNGDMTLAIGSYAVANDGNGNIAGLVKATDATTTAQYEYGPFGELLRASNANPPVRQSLGGGGFQFSTKYQDDETDLLYYGYRYYNPSAGLWPSRGPIAEEGGLNLYGFVANTPVNAVDQLGLVIVGFYGADISYRWPNWGNELLEEISGIMEMYEKVLRPSSQWRTYPLYHSRADSQAFSDLLRYLDTNKDGYYNPPCDNEETIKIFGWSWGGASAVELANRINDSDKFKKKNVGLVAVIDPVTAFRTGKHTVPSNVYRLWNRYQRNGRNVLPLGLPNHGNQFLNADPSGFSGGLNFYAYADGNPVSMIDPFGLGAIGEGTGSSWVTRGWGALEALGGGLTAGFGYTFGTVTAPTVAGGIAGAAIGTYGLDMFQAGVRQMWTGQQTPTMVQSTLQSAGMSPTAAAWTSAGIGVAMTGGASIYGAYSSTVNSVPTIVAVTESSSLTGTEVARAALGFGPLANPGAPLTPAMVAALQENLAAAQSSLRLAQQGLNVAGNAVSAEQAAIQISTTQQRINTINQILQSGVQAPKH